MNIMSFNFTLNTISLLTCIFLSGFSQAGTNIIPSRENVFANPVLSSHKQIEIAQNSSMADLESEIISQINQARAKPSDYADWLETQKQYYDGVMLKLPGERPIRTNRGLEALTEAIDFVRQQNPLPPLNYSEALAIAAQEQLTQVTSAGNQADALNRNISYGKVTAEAIVFQLVVDDGIRDRRHRLAIFTPTHQEAGIACRADQIYQQICAISYAGDSQALTVVDNGTENLVEKEDGTTIPATESAEEITIAPETAIAPEREDITTPEISPTPEVKPTPEINPTPEVKPTPEVTSDETNDTQSQIPNESLTPSALNTQPNTSLAVAQVERGFLEEGDKVIPNDGSFYDSYPISGKAGESFLISLESTDFDAFLAIMDEEGNILEQNDDVSEDDSNSQLEITLPNDGTYSLIVNSYDQEGKGAYILTIRR